MAPDKGRGVKTCVKGIPGKLESLKSDPDGLPGLRNPPVTTVPAPTLADFFVEDIITILIRSFQIRKDVLEGGGGGASPWSEGKEMLQEWEGNLVIKGCDTFGASYTTRSLGRRLTMLIAGIFFIIGTILNVAAINFLMLVLGRLMLGCGVGFANQFGFAVIQIIKLNIFSYAHKYHHEIRKQSILKPPLQFTRSVASTTSSSSHCLSTGTELNS
ncbi:hypothetical protein G4B88_020018 [Cannabis sativa]|uniref:Uncharacterized protein n=1 Tax=Cannabis sativa TaxID=3483 RepID=A0A7J6FD52_CANSA|nr:hypothetical protein G4B88_020018 [Cannabis sativa]